MSENGCHLQCDLCGAAAVEVHDCPVCGARCCELCWYMTDRGDMCQSCADEDEATGPSEPSLPEQLAAANAALALVPKGPPA